MRKLPWLLVAVIAVAAGVFAPVRHFDFVSIDDHLYVGDNPLVRGGLTWALLWQMFASTYANFWHPLTVLSLALDVRLFGVTPGPMHVTSLLLHLVSAALLFLALRRATDQPGPSALVAALFAVHPLHVESVAWIAQRKDTLSTVFWMLTMYAYVAYAGVTPQAEAGQHARDEAEHEPAAARTRRAGARRPSGQGAQPRHRRSGLAYLLVVLCFALGLMAKPMLVTLPLVLLMLDVWPLRRIELAGGLRQWRSPEVRRAIVEKVPLVAMSAAAAILAVVAQQRGGAVATLEGFSVASRLANAPIACVSYVARMIWPGALTVFYPYAQTLPVWPAVGAAVLLTAVSILTLKAAAKHPYVAVGWFWFLVTLLPVSGLVQVGSHAMADRYTYVPLVGLFIAVAWAGHALSCHSTTARRLMVCSACASVVLLAAAARAQVMTWRNSFTLWQHAVAVMPDNYYAHNALGLEYHKQGRTEAAAAQFVRASQLAPGFPNGHNNLGLLLADQGRTAEAIEHYREAVRRAPQYVQAHVNLANALVQLGQLDEAIRQYEEAIRLKPDAAGMVGLGNALLLRGRVEQAIAQFEEALQLDGDAPRVHDNLANALVRAGRLDAALRHYQAAVSREPDVFEVRENYGIALVRAGRPIEAVEQFEAAARLRPQSASVRANFGNGLLAAGRVAEAVKQFRQAVSIDPREVEARLGLGTALFELGNFADALEQHRIAATLAPGRADVRFNLALTLERVGQLGEAAAQFQETLRLEGESTDVHLALAGALERLGRFSESSRHYAAALSLKPGLEQARAGLERVSRRSARAR